MKPIKPRAIELGEDTNLSFNFALSLVVIRRLLKYLIAFGLVVLHAKSSLPIYFLIPQFKNEY